MKQSPIDWTGCSITLGKVNLPRSTNDNREPDPDDPDLLLKFYDTCLYSEVDVELMFDLETIPYGNRTVYDAMRYVHYLGRKKFIANSIVSHYLTKTSLSLAVPWLVSDHVSRVIGEDLLDREISRSLERKVIHHYNRLSHEHLPLLSLYLDGQYEKAIEQTSSRIIAATVSLHEGIMDAVNQHDPDVYTEVDRLNLSAKFLEVFPTSYLVLR